MTEHEAKLMINEARSVHPSFVRGRQRYTIMNDGSVEIERAVGKSGLRWTYEMTVDGDWIALHPDVKQRARDFMRRSTA